MTGRDLVTAALRLIGAVAPGESLGAQEATDGLAALNRMLGSWTNENLLIHAPVREEFALTPADGSYSMGTGGDFDTTRPTEIERAGIEISGSSNPIEMPIKVIRTVEEWARIRDKESTATIPEYLYCEGTYPLETLNLYPIPSAGNNLVLYSRKPLTEIAAIGTTVTFPPGYDRALIYNLAIELAPEYGRSAPAEVVSTAMESKAVIKRTNEKPRILRVDTGIAALGGFNIYTGESN